MSCGPDPPRSARLGVAHQSTTAAEAVDLLRWYEAFEERQFRQSGENEAADDIAQRRAVPRCHGGRRGASTRRGPGVSEDLRRGRQEPDAGPADDVRELYRGPGVRVPLPLRPGDKGWNPGLDRHNDGRACEP